MKALRRSVSMLMGGSLLFFVACVVAPPPPPGVVFVSTGPPSAQVEVIGTAPGPEFVWIHGYYRYDANHYVWAPGRWERRPHANAVWVDGHWAHHHSGYYWVEGHWS